MTMGRFLSCGNDWLHGPWKRSRDAEFPKHRVGVVSRFRPFRAFAIAPFPRADQAAHKECKPLAGKTDIGGLARSPGPRISRPRRIGTTPAQRV